MFSAGKCAGGLFRRAAAGAARGQAFGVFGDDFGNLLLDGYAARFIKKRDVTAPAFLLGPEKKSGLGIRGGLDRDGRKAREKLAGKRFTRRADGREQAGDELPGFVHREI